jgi:hypothetical protein
VIGIDEIAIRKGHLSDCGERSAAGPTALSGEHRHIMPRVVDGLAAAERARMLGDNPSVLTDHDAVGIGMDLDRSEESLWYQHEADIGNLFETIEVPKLNRKGEPILDKDGNPVTHKRQVPRDLQTLPPEVRHAIESISVDAKGNTTVKLANKLQANAELRKMLGLDKPAPQQSEFDRMSDADLINELAKQANELGVQIDLSYKFGEGE